MSVDESWGGVRPGDPAARWDSYLRGFHAARPGITEGILRRASSGGDDAYSWLAAAVPQGALVLDVGCGSGPLFAELAGRCWIGLDGSAAELALARSAGARPLLRAGAAAIPLRDASVDAVACSMSLMVATPVPRVLDEIARVLRPGGLLAATVPAGGPLHAADRLILAGLLAALGQAPGYPAGRVTERIPAMLACRGLTVLSNERRRFGYPMHDRADADRLLDSLYLPGVSDRRYRGARRYLRALARRGATIPVPLRRIVARRPATATPGGDDVPAGGSDPRG